MAAYTSLSRATQCSGVGEHAAKLDGVDKVLVVEAPHLANQLAEEMAALIHPLMNDYDAVMAAATTNGKKLYAAHCSDARCRTNL